MAIDQNDPAFGRPELLARAADRAVKAGKLAASATSDVVQILANKCIVELETELRFAERQKFG